jgi:hypothetical protein
MNLNQLSDQLKDVPQNRLIDYAQNPNSVVPQFLALAEIQRRQQLSAQAQPPQSTVANDVLAQAQPSMPQQMPPQGVVSLPQPQQAPQQMAQQLPENQPGVSQLPSGMPQGMAAGGIVAFADGGMADEEEDDRETARLFPRLSASGFSDFVDSIPEGIRSLAKNISAPREDTKLKQATMQPNTPETSARKGGHKYEQAVLDEAKRQGVDPALALHVLYKETGGLKDPDTARSKAGAYGPMQLMPKTAAYLGVDPTNPLDNIRGGIAYLREMGDKYKENRLTAAAYNAGPGNLDKALRRQGGLDTLPTETRNYIAGLAQGGHVKKYSGKTEDGSEVKDDSLKDNEYLNRSRSVVDTVKSAYDALTTPKNYDLYDIYQRNIGQPFSRGVDRFVNEPVESQAQKFRSYSMTPDKAPTVGYSTPAGSNTPAPTSMTRAEADRLANVSAASNAQRKEGLFSKPSASTQPTMAPNVPMGPYDDELRRYSAATAPTAPKSKADLLEEEMAASLEKQVAELAKQGKVNLAMSVLQAGLGMMASKSPYALGGIGEGGQQGVNTFATLKKQEADQLKDINAMRLGMYKYGAAREGAAADNALREKIYGGKQEQADAAFTQRQLESTQRQSALARDDFRQYEQMKLKALQDKYPVPMPKDPGYQAAMQAIYNDPVYKELYAMAFPNLVKNQSAAPTGNRPPLSTFNK